MRGSVDDGSEEKLSQLKYTRRDVARGNQWKKECPNSEGAAQRNVLVQARILVTMKMGGRQLLMYGHRSWQKGNGRGPGKK